MILYLNFEEIAALSATARDVLGAGASGHGVIAPPRIDAEVEQFVDSLSGDIGVHSLAEQQRALRVVRHLLQHCRIRMDHEILEEHPAAETAVAAYFTFAHMLTVERRVVVMGEEMAKLVRLMTGEDPDSDTGRRFSFPD